MVNEMTKYAYMLLALLMLQLSFSFQAIAKDVYQWTDKNGVIHFSDSPPADDKAAKHFSIAKPNSAPPSPEYGTGEQITQPHNNTAPQQNAALESTATATDSTEATPVVKKELPKLVLGFTNLVHDQTLRNNQGIINIALSMNRSLSIGEQLQLMLDGSRYGAPQTDSNWEIKNIDRGSHTLSVNAVESGKVIASTSPITVHLHRTTVK